MKKKIGTNPTLYSKVLLFSFLISFLVAVSTATVSFLMDSSQLRTMLKERVLTVSQLWSATISVDDIYKVKGVQSEETPAFKRLTKSMELINERGSEYLNGYLLDSTVRNSNEVFVIVTSYDNLDGFTANSTYKAGPIFMDSYLKAISKQKTVTTEIFRDQYGVWITSFTPLVNEVGKVVAVFAVDVDASMIDTYAWKSIKVLTSTFLFISILVYFILKWGLRKVLQPVHDIVNGINEVSAGNFNVKLHISDPSDLWKISEKFNDMTRQLKVLFERVTDTSSQLINDQNKYESLTGFEKAIDDMDQIIHHTKIQKELQRAEKMNAIGQLAASVAHEIRNPMTVVKGFLQIFVTSESMSDQDKTYVQLMIEELDRAETIINDYLSLAKPDIEESERIDCSELGNKAIDLIQSYALMSKNIVIKRNIQNNTFVRGNKSELRQVLINILKNGIESMKDGGVLTLSIKEEEGFVVFKIKDMGIGMSEEEISRLGTAFYSLKEKGTGIGLMVCFQIINRMKGRIEIRSQKEKGTTFSIYVPKDEIS